MEWYINIFFIVFIILLAFSYITNVKMTLFCDGCQEETWWYRCSKGSGLGTKTCEARKMMQPLIDVADKFSKFSFSVIKMAIFTVINVYKIMFRMIVGMPFIIWQMFKDIGCIIGKFCNARAPRLFLLSGIPINWKLRIPIPTFIKDMVRNLGRLTRKNVQVGDINIDFGAPIKGIFKATDKALFLSIKGLLKIVQVPCLIFGFIGKSLHRIIRPVINEIMSFVDENINKVVGFLLKMINSFFNLIIQLKIKIVSFIWNKTILLLEKILPFSIKEFFITLLVILAGIVITILFFVIMALVSIIQSSTPSFQ